jgi:hypothetical protein
VAPRLADRPTVPASTRYRVQWWWFAVAAAALLLVYVLPRLVDTTPATVPRLTIVNPSGYDIDVSLTDASHNGLMPVGTARAHTSTDFGQVIDQGPNWVFHFASPDATAPEVAVSRSTLKQQGWREVIPDAVIQQLTSPAPSSVPGNPSSPNTSAP